MFLAIVDKIASVVFVIYGIIQKNNIEIFFFDFHIYFSSAGRVNLFLLFSDYNAINIYSLSNICDIFKGCFSFGPLPGDVLNGEI